MARPYLSTRTGSTQWVMQRVSAILLIVLAFGHFFLQHFTADAVSTGLTVAARLNNPWWQAYYVVFIALALYHGINGVVGILRDYAPPRRWRFAAEVVLWSLAAYFGARGIMNVGNPIPLGTVKESYANRGFPKGESLGNPPMPGGAKSYDFRLELRELLMLEYYLEHHVHRSEDTPLAAVFAHQAGTPDPATTAAAGKAFDAWCLSVIWRGNPAPELRDRHTMFSSSYEFAVWAQAVRRVDATLRGETRTWESVPAYSATLH
jgi:succinate dehydrogenase / fumarate reductase membrane anchor subunit